MKKFILFTLYAVALLAIFVYILEAMALPNIAMWLNQHIYYLFGLLILHIACLLALFFLQRKKLMQQSPNNKEQAKLKLQLNIKSFKESRIFLLMIALFLIYCGTVLFFFDWSYQNFAILISGLSLTYLGIVTILFWAYRRNNKWKLERLLQAQEVVALKLRSIRSQLNPHFMFNALTSIQNLMNKNEIAAANHYLALFASITRKVLNTSDLELICLADELQMLEEYIQMEQLRFGFNYQINVADGINTANTDIPVMLLQPFVENAVKHGVAALQQKGVIDIQVGKTGDDLILLVRDNGPGFDVSFENPTGFGLKLSEERIALLNLINKDQPVILSIDSKPGNTEISIKLVNLLT